MEKKKERKIKNLLLLLIFSVFVSIGSSAAYAADSGTDDYSQQVFESLADKRAGVVDGTPHDQFINAKIKGSSFSYFKNFQDIALALQENKIDFFISPDITFRMLMKNFPEIAMLKAQLVSLDVGMIFPKDSTHEPLRDEMNDYISKIKDSGELESLRDYWLYSDREDAQLEVPRQGEKGILNMATSTTLEPYSYQKDGQIMGFDIAVMAGFCKERGYGLNIDDMDFSGVLAAIGSAKYDVGGACISYTEERAKSVNFSDPTFTQQVFPAVRKDDFKDLINSDTLMYVPTDGNESIWDKIVSAFVGNFITENRWLLILSGIGITLIITVSSVICGSLLGFGLCMLNRLNRKVSNKIVRIYTWLFQGTPVVILLMIFYYIIFGNSSFPGIIVACITFSLNFAAYATEVFTTGIHTIGVGQKEAALALGYTETESFFTFILPQALRVCLPVYKSQIITLLKGTSIVGYIAIQDLTKVGDIIRSRTFEPFFPLITSAVLYFILAYLLVLLLRVLTNRFLPEKSDPKKGKLLKGVKIHD